LTASRSENATDGRTTRKHNARGPNCRTNGGTESRRKKKTKKKRQRKRKKRKRKEAIEIK